MSKTTGTVFLIGGGPGDPELITTKGLRRLRQADVVVYDHLAPYELVATLPPEIERHYVGKQAAYHTVPQDDINRLLVRFAKEGKNVARLKGGDPFTFGRGGEEATFLKKNGIEFEIVPGITAGSGALAYAGIPPTDRRSASGVLFVTGHGRRDTDSAIDWSWVAAARNVTTVIYMGVGEIASIVDHLLKAGHAPDTPAAIVERGTTSDQRTLFCALNELPETTTRNKVHPPALYVVGEVAAIGEELVWFEKGPLFGKRVLVTRPADQAVDMWNQLRALGAEIIPLPTIATRPVIDEGAWRKLARWEGPTSQWLVLTSENSVRYFVRQFTETFGDVRRLAGFRIAAVGFGTARALRRHHLKADFIPTKATTASLAAELSEHANLLGARVLRVRGNLGDETVENILAGAGADVLSMHVYETLSPEWPDHMKQEILQRPPDIITFTSGSSADGFVANVSKDELPTFSKTVVASIGPSTSKVIKSHGLRVTVEASTHSIPGLLESLLNYYHSHKG